MTIKLFFLKKKFKFYRNKIFLIKMSLKYLFYRQELIKIIKASLNKIKFILIILM